MENEERSTLYDDISAALDTVEAEQSGDVDGGSPDLSAGSEEAHPKAEAEIPGDEASGAASVEAQGSAGKAEPRGDEAESRLGDADGESGAGHLSDPKDAAAPPQSANALVRENWGKVPKEVQDWVNQREREMGGKLRENSEVRQRGEIMDQVMRPYQQYFAMNGNNPPALMNQLLQTGAMLQMGSPQQVAQAVAGIIKQYGADVNLVADSLEGTAGQAGASHGGQPVQQGYTPQQLEQVVNQLVDQRTQVAKQQQATAEASQTIEQFQSDPQNEFFKDVSPQMARLLESAANNGEAMTIKEAYDEACWSNPGVRQVMLSRQQSEALQNKRRAASSISGQPGGPPPTAEDMSMTDTIAAAWDLAENRSAIR